jgi:hypothetical protein
METKPKRKYTRRNGVTNKSTNNNPLPLHGLQLVLDPGYTERVKNEQQPIREREFRETVLTKFEDFINDEIETIRKTSNCPDDVQLPPKLGEVTVKYSRELDSEMVFLPGCEYGLRNYVGLMSLMKWSANRIVKLEKQIDDLKSRNGNTDSKNETTQAHTNESSLSLSV